MKKQYCQCATCVKLRSKFTPEECRQLREYAHAMMQACRERNRRKHEVS